LATLWRLLGQPMALNFVGDAARYLRPHPANIAHPHGRPAFDGEAKYLITASSRCNVCDGSIYVKSRSHAQQRAYFYGCTSFHLLGRSVCTNDVEVSMAVVDEQLWDAIACEAFNSRDGLKG
jgi:hypothetical protein